MTIITIENRKIGLNEPVFIIAEIGVNHNGNPELAHEMIDMVAESGCDCVKFQTFTADEFCNDPDDTYEYISQGKVVKESMLEMFRRLEFGYDEFDSLFKHARQRNLVPLSTPTDRNAVTTLNRLDCKAFKIGSDDLVYTPFLNYVAKQSVPIIISTGMAEVDDIDRAVTTIKNAGNNEIIILHCISEYPTSNENINLNRIDHLYDKYPDYVIGYSDHSWGITAAIGAVTKGAKVIEKHITLDNDLPGPDHRFSANPNELNNLVNEIRVIEQALGDYNFVLSEQDKKMATLCHRSIYASKNLNKNHELSYDDLVYQRPGTGLMPYYTDEILGKKLNRNIHKGEAITMSMVDLNNE